ncbi:MAG: hypothetical protein EOP49_30620, partial [Sphingobacteriales bacterium]
MRLAWGDNAVGLQILTLNANGNYITHYSPTINNLNTVHGLEFVSYGELIIAQDNYTASQKGLAKVSFGSNLNVTFLPGTSAYYNSFIERAPDGKYYTTKPNIVNGNTSGYKLSEINYANATVTDVPNLTLPNMDLANPNRLLPDQVDHEDYIATNYRADLMSRDAVTDMGLEPNPSEDIWASPDLWNRRNSLGNPNDNQNPGYGGGGNLMKVRIKNRGCMTSQTSYVKLYWTLGATLERWPASWDSTTFINNVVAGKEIKTAGLGYADYQTVLGVDKGYEIAPLAPGQEVIITAKWTPPNPMAYNDTPRIGNDAMICFLARIDDPTQDPMYSELSSNTTSTGRNVRYNNNIVTRNTNLTNAGGEYMVVPGGGTILVGNYFEEARHFNIRFHAKSTTDMGFSEVGSVTLRLDENLWNAWMESGAEGEGIDIENYETRTLTVNDLEHAALFKIEMRPDELMGIGAYFTLNGPTDIQETYQFICSQEMSYAEDDAEQYGSQCVFAVAVHRLVEV